MDLTQLRSDAQRGPVAMKARIVKDAKRSLTNPGDAIVIERYVSMVVDELYGDSIKVTTFVPVLAMRRVRDLVEVDATTAARVAISS